MADADSTSCAHCGAHFVIKSSAGRPQIYCSASCRYRAKYKRRCDDRGPEWKKALPSYGKRYKTPGYKKKQTVFKCAECGVLFLRLPGRGFKYCSEYCKPVKERSWLKQTMTIMSCAECNEPFIPDTAHAQVKYCGRKCLKKSIELSEKCRTRKALRRAKKYTSGRCDPIDPIKVFDRDGWCCYLCGDETPKSLRGKHKPKSPEMDHVIPLNRDGTHTWDNVRCACRACNLKKSDNEVIEMMGEWFIIPKLDGSRARWLTSFR